MNRKLIAIDLDGTTLNQQSQVSPRTKEVLTRAQAQGHIISIVTGRPNRLSIDIYEALGLKTPMINFNGSLGYFPHHDWDQEYQYTFPREVAFDLLQRKDELGLSMIAAEGKNLFLAVQEHPVEVGFFPSILQANQLLNQRSLQQNPTSVTVAVDRDKQAAFLSYMTHQFGEIVDVAPWGGPNSVVEIGVKGVQKATGVEVLAHYYGIHRDNIVAFGDEHNDTAMIDYAGWGVAMANATDQIKALADDVTPLNNEQDGLANYLEDYLKLAE